MASLRQSIALMHIQEQIKSAQKHLTACQSSASTLDNPPLQLNEALGQVSMWFGFIDQVLNIHLNRIPMPAIPVPPSDTEQLPADEKPAVDCHKALIRSAAQAKTGMEPMPPTPLLIYARMSKPEIQQEWARLGLPMAELDGLLGKHRPSLKSLDEAMARIQEEAARLANTSRAATPVTEPSEGSTEP